MTLFTEAIQKIDEACAGFIAGSVANSKLQDARCLITSVLMRAVGIQKFLVDTNLNEINPTVEIMCKLRGRVHEAFGSPGDWGGDLGKALSQLYKLEITAQG